MAQLMTQKADSSTNGSSGGGALSSVRVRSVLLTSGTLAPLDTFAHELQLEFKQRLENPHIVSSGQVSDTHVGKNMALWWVRCCLAECPLLLCYVHCDMGALVWVVQLCRSFLFPAQPSRHLILHIIH